MNRPYSTALEIPFFFVAAFLVKKETVNGTIGKTQGVMKATSPPRNPSRKIVSNPDLPCSAPAMPVPPQLFTGFFKSMEDRQNQK